MDWLAPGQVSQQDQNGSSLINWDISVNNNVMTIEEFQQAVPGTPLPGDSRRQLQLSNVTFEATN